MILVTVGTDNHDFSRLLRKMDEIAKKEKVVMQTGHSLYQPRYAKWFSFETNEVIEDLYRKASIIITHGGAGSIISSLVNGKIPIVVPRQKKWGEHINDHQRDLAQFLSKKGKVVLVDDVEDIGKSISVRKKVLRQDKKLLLNLDQYLKGLERV